MSQEGKDWRANAIKAGKAVVDRRVEVGYRTRAQFADDVKLTVKTLGEIERGERPSYDQSTLSTLDQGLRWPIGTVAGLLAGRPAPRDIAGELMSAPGVLANLYVNRMDLTEEIHDPRLGPEARYRLIRMVRLDDVERDRQLRAKVAAEKQRMIEAGEGEA